MTAPIEKRHRELTFTAVWKCAPSANERIWIDTGEGVGGGPLLRGVAQAMADLEAATGHRAWGEGYESSERRSAGRVVRNPYPVLEMKA